MKLLRFFIVLICLTAPAQALIQPDEMILPPAREAEAQALFAHLRCPTCTHQSLLESEAEMARDIRMLIRRELAAGKTPQQITEMLQQSYGDAVFMTPPYNEYQSLWLLPIAVFALVLLLFTAHYMRQSRSAKP